MDEEEYIPHQNLEDPDFIIANSKIVANDIFANSNGDFKNVNQSMKDQNDYLNNLNNEIRQNFDQNSNQGIDNINIGGDTEDLKFTIYKKLSDVSNQFYKPKSKLNFCLKKMLLLKIL